MEHIIARDAIAVIVNPENPVSQLTLKQISDIYSGKISNWSEVGGEDRPITAPAAGIVIFTGKLTVRGNATIIDHGWGVYSGYWHQSAIDVQVGQRVEPGEVIGYQGNTGRVTGPHLHWEMWVGGNDVDPLQWTTETFP